MNKLISLVTASAALLLIFVVTNAYASQPKSQGWDRSYGVDEIIGCRVKNLQGENLGRVKDLVFDSDGQITLAVLSYGGFLGIGGRPIAVPFGGLSYNHEGKYLVLDISKERLESGPRYWGADIIDKNWMEGVYRYYGLQPYWTEGRSGSTENPVMGKPTKD